MLPAEDLLEISTNKGGKYEQMLESALNIQQARGFNLVTIEETGSTSRWILRKEA